MATASELTRAPRVPLARWRWLSRRSARLRLAVMFAGLFLLLGTVLIVAIVGLARGGSTVAVAVSPHRLSLHVGKPGAPPGAIVIPPGTKDVLAQQHSADSARLLAISWFVLAVTALASGVLGWFLAGRVLRPLRDMAETARTITAGNLHRRLALTGPEDEFKQLGDTLDDLLSRLESSFEAQRRFVANASHELRTPLTVERTLLQVALAHPDADEQSLRTACEELLVSQRDHEALLEALLTLASSERGLELREPLELSAVVREELDARAERMTAVGVTVNTELEQAPTGGDPVLVARLVANLLDNALDHNVASGGVISVRTAREGDRAVLAVANTGALIGADAVARLAEPFQRLGRVGDDGHHGLGLSIVRAITQTHNGELRLEALPTGGLSVTVELPALPRAAS